jgi:hypothetical protein
MKTKFTFDIKSTIKTRDHSDNIIPGDILYAGDEAFDTEAGAITAGVVVLSGIDGGGAFNLARDSAVVCARAL